MMVLIRTAAVLWDLMGSANGNVCEWIALGLRLWAASPHKVDEIVAMVRRIVEGQELIASADRMLVMRGKRPTDRFDA